MVNLINFDNKKNRFIRLEDVSDFYIERLKNLSQTDRYYPHFHIAPKHGLLNDPNGLIFHNGEYHIFYQWFPLGPVHGLKYWYHVSTQNFVHYKDHGIALYPNCSFDKDGCFSGSAIADKNNDELILFYTGNQITETNQLIQSQVFAKLDHSFQVKKKQRFALESPPGYTEDFRDPFVVERSDQIHVMVGGMKTAGEASIAFYSGSGLYDLTFKGSLQMKQKLLGEMCECPNYFESSGKGVLIFSPQGMKKNTKYDFNNVFSVVYAIGDPLDFDQLYFSGEEFVELDKGFDFYAPQIFADNERQLLIGWLGNSKMQYPTDKNYWAHMLTLPREIYISDDKLSQKPIKELEKLRYDEARLEHVHNLHKSSFEVKGIAGTEFSIKITNEDNEYIVFSGNDSEYQLDRTHTTDSFALEYGTIRYAIRDLNRQQDIHIFVDHSSIEIFCDEGTIVFTSRFFVNEMSNIVCEGFEGALYHLDSLKWL
ncbi:glycoside hydrolase family 32 protein [Salisediminibacterium halotolerans]|uniref:Sucrose-6-phosphate hydrolase n=1 Tax=Salisediminibacterium halotolerans TaxID=517425 RepID=A0A1H9VWM5_9BACI|nr:sucrose-6-phosphate hydrolase [Salisediminibacterium haloalkalitolerans]SES25929.1 beta-fructofuranosidase [Salisediminibacterium haloalkalitolerans]